MTLGQLFSQTSHIQASFQITTIQRRRAQQILSTSPWQFRMHKESTQPSVQTKKVIWFSTLLLPTIYQPPGPFLWTWCQTQLTSEKAVLESIELLHNPLIRIRPVIKINLYEIYGLFCPKRSLMYLRKGWAISCYWRLVQNYHPIRLGLLVAEISLEQGFKHLLIGWYQYKSRKLHSILRYQIR